MKIRELVWNPENKGYFFRGLLMGAADVVPGVSGGTIAFITGIYYDLIQSIAQISFVHFFHLVRLVIFIWHPLRRNQSLKLLAQLNWQLFIPLGLGIVAAILSLSKIIPFALTEYPQPTYALFFGLVIASLKEPLRQIDWHLIHFFLLIMTSLVFFSFFHFGGVLSGSQQPLYLMLSGALAICALILPGISGSYILLMLGQYQLILEAIHQKQLVVLGLFILGMLIGLFSFIRILRWLLAHFFSTTLCILCGIMVGSLRILWPLQYGQRPQAVFDWLVVLAFGILGIALVLILGLWSKATDKEI